MEPAQNIDRTHGQDPGGILITEVPDDERTTSKSLDITPDRSNNLSNFSKIPQTHQSNEESTERYSGQNEAGSYNSSVRPRDQKNHSGNESYPTAEGRIGVDADRPRSQHRITEETTRDQPGEEENVTWSAHAQQEDEEDFVDSLSVDIVSDTFSEELGELETRDEDYDTDLEIDGQKWLNPERYDHDISGLSKYLQACRQQNITPIRHFIKHMLDENVNLCFRGMGPAAMKALAASLEVNTTIEVLNLEGNWIHSEGAHHLCRVLKDNVYITYLNLAENKLGNQGGQCIFDLLLENRSLEWLDLTGNEIGDAVAENLCKMLKKNLTLRRLVLRHNQLEDVGAQCMKEALSDNTSLESLDISWNHFRTRGCVLIAEGLKENAGLKDVNVSMNGFGLEGGIALGEAIGANSTLLRLDASYCRLPTESAGSLSKGLQGNETLKTLVVGFNSLASDGTFTILVGIQKNDSSSLELLDLGKTKVSKDFKELQDKLASERGLSVLHNGVMLETLHKEVGLESMDAFKRDPLTKLKEWLSNAGYSLTELLQPSDRNENSAVFTERLISSIKVADIHLTDEQISILLNALKESGDGTVSVR